MDEIPYVSPDAHETARKMELKFTGLAPDAGVIFISVVAVPAPGGRSKQFEVRLGLSRQYEISTGLALIRKILESEIESGLELSASVYRGVPGMSRGFDSIRRPSLAS